MSEERDFVKDIKLDRFELEVEAEEQSTLYQYWSDELADAKKDRDVALNEFDQLKAERMLYYRLNPIKTKDSAGKLVEQKVSETNILAMVDVDPHIIKSKKIIAQLRYRVNKLEGRLAALDHKKRMIDNLRHLYISGYYSNPVKGDDKADKQRESLNK